MKAPASDGTPGEEGCQKARKNVGLMGEKEAKWRF